MEKHALKCSFLNEYVGLNNSIVLQSSRENKIKLIGKQRVENKNRAPTISFTVEGITSEKVSEALVSQDIAIRNDNFYAWRCLRALGIDTDDGVVRASMVHYNNLDDIDKLIQAFKNTKILN